MFTQKRKSLIFFVILLVIVLLLVAFFYYRMANNKKPQKDQIEEQASLDMIKEPDYVKPVAEEDEYYDSSEVTYDLVGIIKEKGEGWVLIEDQTPQPPGQEKKSSEPIKINITADTKIAKDKRLIDYQEIKVDDQVLLKIQQEGENLLATDLLISSLQQN